ncbi:MAG: PQQ-binding-like beta-propeller repeat protein [Rhodobacterales bacterium]|nr:PQQ-binding-like beta-propeller repeat protein [Rhodobacterales bacterium]
MWWLIGLAFAGTQSAMHVQELKPLTGQYEGELHAAPSYQWSVRLPGPRMNTSIHSEHARPVPFGADGLLIGSAAGNGIYLMSRRDGTVLQHYPGDGSVEAAPAVVEDRIYFADVAGNTWCYKGDGTLVWHHSGNAPILVRPVVHQGLVFVTNVDDLAVALDAFNGDLNWRYEARKEYTRESELTLYAAPPATIIDNEVLLGFSDGSLVGLEWETGVEQWSKKVGEGRYPDIVAQPILHASDVYTSGYYKPLLAMDRESHDVRWRLDEGAAAAAVIDNTVTPAMLYHPGSDGTLRAINSLTGAIRWEWESGTSGALTSPVITPAGLVVASSEGGVYLIDATTGKESWRFHESYLLQGVSSEPTVLGRQMFFVSNAGNLYAMVVPKRRRE